MRTGIPVLSVRTQPDEFKRRQDLPRHFSAFAAAAVACLWLAGCAQAPLRDSARGPVAQPLAQVDLAAASATAKASALVFAAEFALQDNHAAIAAADYAKAARLSRDPAVARRALQLALATHDASASAALLQRWQALGAGAAELAAARGQLALLRGDQADAERQFRGLLASGDADAWKSFAAALAGARDAALAGNVLEDLATPAQLPNDENVWVAMGQLGEHLGRRAFARKLAQAAVLRFDGVASIRWAASLRLAGGDRAGATALYAKGVAAHPQSAELRLGYAALLVNQDQFDEALRILARGPQTDATWSARVAYAARARNEGALRQLYAELQHAPLAQRTDSAFLLGQLAELLHHDRDAMRWYAKVDPYSRRAFDAKARSAVLLDKAGQSASAHAMIAQLQHDYADDPDQLRAAYELGAQLYSRHGKHADAIAVYDRGLAALPGDTTLTYDRGVEEINADNTQAALADFRAVLAADPDNVEAMNALGFTLADADRDLGEATRLLGKALAAKPDVPAIMDSWGWLQYRLGHLDQARTYLERAWNKQHDPDIGVHLGEVLWKLGRQRDARAVFAKVRKADPDNASLRRVERRLHP